ncbi:MAG: DNRLRE domain-containing protein [Planctomycetota bacterium]
MTRPHIMAAVLAAGVGAAATADVLQVEPDKDNTLYGYTSGQFSNGAGTGLFVGRNLAEPFPDGARRTVVSFDLSKIPAGARVNAVSLTMVMTLGQFPVTPVSLHRAETDWGEGGSIAGGSACSGGGGGGEDAETDDATWTFASFPTTTWNTLGGDFVAEPSASVSVGGTGPYTWASTPELVADVQGWINGSLNAGWVIIGDESSAGTAKRFASREAVDTGCGAVPPLLTIDYSTCPADTNGDGAVDVQDLVNVILAWGTDDIAADVNGDGTVDVQDLVDVIVAWGPCS